MRRAFAESVFTLADDDRVAFLTGDLGFMALEPVRDAFGDRFVNIGVAEQNMIGVAAGIARSGMRVVAYSIAPFATWRAAEQVKIDIGLNRLPVCIVGNGGGYGYGYMGPTHHAIDDIALMSAAGFRCAAPAFDHQVGEFLTGWDGPMYLRLGLDESAGLDMERPSVPAGISPVLPGRSGHVIALGSLVSSAVRAFMDRSIETRPTVWQCVELPVVSLPGGLSELGQGEPVMVVEEHIQSGGLGQQLAYAFLRAGLSPKWRHLSAAGYPSGRYGSQKFHREESGLDPASMESAWQEITR